MNPMELNEVAEKAWNSTKDKADPKFEFCNPDHRGKLLTAARAVVDNNGKSSGIVGLEAFDAEVAKLTKAEEALAVSKKK